MSSVKIVECPRDAWQSLPRAIPAEICADYLRTLIAAGFEHIEAVSFVSPEAIPQMAEPELVLEYLDPPDDVELIGIAVNAEGAERAARTNCIQTLCFPYSLSVKFLQTYQSRTADEALESLEAIGTIASRAGIDLAANISMAFGNPYGEPWDIDEIITACDLLADNGVTQVTLADTFGRATPKLIADTVSDVLGVHDHLELGLHLHLRPEGAAARVAAAYNAGCRRFDTSIGGTGGCLLAQDALVGNLATEQVLPILEGLGAKLSRLTPLDGLMSANREIERRYGNPVQ